MKPPARAERPSEAGRAGRGGHEGGAGERKPSDGGPLFRRDGAHAPEDPGAGPNRPGATHRARFNKPGEGTPRGGGALLGPPRAPAGAPAPRRLSA
ncbi:hypothetical protein GCM10010275_14500 [Streptomyces litmocidini]|nr:hypothetical protein GCM10010275_14500 [Streptomyces litmocidini]